MTELKYSPDMTFMEKLYNQVKSDQEKFGLEVPLVLVVLINSKIATLEIKEIGKDYVVDPYDKVLYFKDVIPDFAPLTEEIVSQYKAKVAGLILPKS